MSPKSNSPGRILISNDDGIDAVGIRILKDIAERLSDDVWVIAPTGNRSGMSRAITLHSDVIIDKVGEREFACSGTPSDCVIMGMARVLDRKPDLVLSGINAGMNVADDVLYSGTIAAAMITMKQIVQASSLRLWVELSIARSSQLASDWTFVTCASILATASFCFATAFSLRFDR